MVEGGASINEQLIEGARRNNLELFQDVIDDHVKTLATDEEKSTSIAHLINETRDPIGNTLLHIAAANGCYEILDYILNQEGVEVDPEDRLNKETPLHVIVRYSHEEPEHGNYLAEMLIEAGADPRMRNKHGQKPIALVLQSNDELRDMLQSVEYAHMMGPSADKNEEEAAVEDEEDEE